LQTLRKLDLNLLRSLDILLATANVSKAAEQLKIGQSTLSAQLARMRVMFNDDLLVPSESGRGLALTPRSLQLQEQVRDVISRIENVLAGATLPSTDATPVAARLNIAVAASDGASLSLAAQCVVKLKMDLGPLLRTSVRQVQLGSFVEQLERGSADLLLSRQAVVPAPLKSKTLATESFVFVQRKGHPRGLQPPTIAEFCEMPHVVPLAPTRHSNPVDEALSFLNLKRNVVIESDSPFVTLEILRCTDYVAAVPSRIVKADELDAFPMPFSVPPMAICMSWHARTHHDIQSRWLRERMIAAAQKLPPPPGVGP